MSGTERDPEIAGERAGVPHVTEIHRMADDGGPHAADDGGETELADVLAPDLGGEG